MLKGLAPVRKQVRSALIYLASDATAMTPINSRGAMSLAEKILNEARTLPEGTLIGAKQFLHVGSRAAVDQALMRSNSARS